MNINDFSCELSLYRKLVPHECLGLTKVRIGRDTDGGYVIPAELLETSKYFLIFGVNDEDSFEMDVYSRTESKNIILCDPFVPYTRKDSPLTFYPVGLSGESLGFMRTLPDFLKEYSIPKDHLFLKIDIEKGEYPSFDTLTKYDFDGVDCLVIEIHSLLEKKYHTSAGKLLDLLNESFVLYHIHANNNAMYDIKNEMLYPDVIECTYISKAYLSANNIQSKPLLHALPDPAVDRQNIHVRSDYPLTWWL
jgi:hypothetical protein